MIKSHIDIDDKEGFLEIVAGKVFHATDEANIASIFKEGAIVPNSDLARGSIFGNSSNGYFRARNCVSFFDYRGYGSLDWREHAYKCFPTSGVNRFNSIAILFLQDTEYSKLLPCSGWKAEESWSERVVPHIEAGYPEEVSIQCINQLLVVSRGPCWRR
jgi:hypothetical protein